MFLTILIILLIISAITGKNILEIILLAAMAVGLIIIPLFIFAVVFFTFF